MDAQVQRLASKAWERYLGTPPTRRLIIAVSGIPGSGKTTLAAKVTARLNELAAPSVVAVFVPMDGYHLTRAQLSAMPDPYDAHFRRGAAFTFDAESFLELLRRVREPLTAETVSIWAPSFDHTIKDPVRDDIAIPRTARIVIFEGNYLSMAKDQWSEIGTIADERWFVEVEEEVAQRRLARRHAAAGIVRTEQEGWERAAKLDLVNGREILENRGPIDEIVISREDD